MLFSLEGLASDLVVRYSSVVMARRLRHPVQLVLPRTNTHGGRRPGAGRPRRERGVSRRRRPEVSPRYPLHVILLLREDVPALRTIVRFKHMKAAFRDGCDRFGLRLCDFSTIVCCGWMWFCLNVVPRVWGEWVFVGVPALLIAGFASWVMGEREKHENKDSGLP